MPLHSHVIKLLKSVYIVVIANKGYYLKPIFSHGFFQFLGRREILASPSPSYKLNPKFVKITIMHT